jgi:hypothetical protein
VQKALCPNSRNFAILGTSIFLLGRIFLYGQDTNTYRANRQLCHPWATLVVPKKM